MTTDRGESLPPVDEKEGALRMDEMTPDAHLAINRANWDERTGIHVASGFYDVERWLREGYGPRTRDAAALGDVSGLRLVHLQCHFGLETLSWARAGAEVTGLDFSSAAIAVARDLAERARLSARSEFVCADVYDAVDVLEPAQFDIVYVSFGSLCWLPSVDRWAAQVAALVAPGGRVYVEEGHPVTWALADDRLCFEHSYFEETEAFVDHSELTYTGDDQPMLNQRNHQWNHSIGETVTALIRHGLSLEWLSEHDWSEFRRFPWLTQSADGTWRSPVEMPRIPMSFSLLARRPQAVRP
jgi:SAM-dependent methyltransferase